MEITIQSAKNGTTNVTLNEVVIGIKATTPTAAK
jgi:hypothetical protein